MGKNSTGGYAGLSKGQVWCEMTPGTQKTDRLIRKVIRRYGFKGLLLEADLRSSDAAEVLGNRKKVIEEAMRISGADYGEIYTRLMKILRYYRALEDSKKRGLEKVVVQCVMCGKPVSTQRINIFAYCKFHRRYRMKERFIKYAREGRWLGRKRRIILAQNREDVERMNAYLNGLMPEEVVTELLRLRKNDMEMYVEETANFAERFRLEFKVDEVIAKEVIGEFISLKEMLRWKQLKMF